MKPKLKDAVIIELQKHLDALDKEAQAVSTLIAFWKNWPKTIIDIEEETINSIEDAPKADV